MRDWRTSKTFSLSLSGPGFVPLNHQQQLLFSLDYRKPDEIQLHGARDRDMIGEGCGYNSALYTLLGNYYTHSTLLQP
jgi:hypothetical protein